MNELDEQDGEAAGGASARPFGIQALVCRPIERPKPQLRPWTEKLWTIQHRYAPYLFISPFIVLFCIFMVYPLGRSIVLSLYQTAGPRHFRFVGLDNFRFLLTDLYFWLAVANTLYFAATFLLIQVPLSLGLAILLNSRAVRFRNFFRFAFFCPHLVGGVFVAVMFSLLLAQRHGVVNRMIGAVAPAIGSEIKWLSNPNLAMPAVVIAALWLSVGYGMIYFLAALQGVDRELYEAAQVDGASPWQQFWHVTLPGIRPVLNFMILIGIIGALQLFELPYVLFQGAGPNSQALTIVMYLYQMGFETNNPGYASAVGWMLVALIFIFSLLQLRTSRMGGGE